jgi:oligoendopeptidase F
LTIKHGGILQGLTQEAWDLAELLPEPSEEIILSRLEELETAVRDFERARDELSPEMSSSRLLELVQDYNDLLARVHVLGYYGSLWFASDTQSEAALAYRNRIEQVLTVVQNRILFFTLWWKQLDDESAARLLPSAGDAADFRHFLEELRRFKPFTLAESSEQLINLKDADGMSAVLTLYSMLTNGFPFSATWPIGPSPSAKLSLVHKESTLSPRCKANWQTWPLSSAKKISPASTFR